MLSVRGVAMKRVLLVAAAVAVIALGVCLPAVLLRDQEGVPIPTDADAPLVGGLTREDIEKRWLVKGESKRPYRELVEHLADYPLEERLRYYLMVAPELRSARSYSPFHTGSLYVLASELALQKELAVLEALEASLKHPDQKRAIYVWLSSRTSNVLWKDRESEDGERGRRLLRKWAEQHPDQIELLHYHPDGFRLLSDILGDKTLDGTQRSESAFCMVTMASIGAVPVEEVIQTLEKFVDDPSPMNDSHPKTEMSTLGARVRERIETLRRYRATITASGLRGTGQFRGQDTQ